MVRQSMIFESEPLAPDPNLLAFVRESVRDLSPENPDLQALHQGYVENHIARISFDLSLVRQFAEPENLILEYGSVPLLLTAALSKASYDIIGIDIAPERYRSSIQRAGLSVVRCDVECDPLPFESNAFDLITFFELFEHLRINPIHTIAEAIRVLKPGGVLLLSTPNLKSLGGIENYLIHGRAYSCCGDIYEEYRKLDRLGHMGHVREYTTVEVREFFEKMGMNVKKIVYRGTYSRAYQTFLIRLFPSLRPFAAYVLEKPA